MNYFIERELSRGNLVTRSYLITVLLGYGRSGYEINRGGNDRV